MLTQTILNDLLIVKQYTVNPTFKKSFFQKKRLITEKMY